MVPMRPINPLGLLVLVWCLGLGLGQQIVHQFLDTAGETALRLSLMDQRNAPVKGIGNQGRVFGDDGGDLHVQILADIAAGDAAGHTVSIDDQVQLLPGKPPRSAASRKRATRRRAVISGVVTSRTVSAMAKAAAVCSSPMVPLSMMM